MSKSKFSAFLYLMLVFLGGVVVGGFTYRLYLVNPVLGGASAPPKRPDPEEVRKHLVQEMRDRVKLDDQQVVQLNRIFDQTREQIDQVHKKANAEIRPIWDNQTAQIKAILRDDQQPLYDQLRAEHDAARKRRHQEKQGPERR